MRKAFLSNLEFWQQLVISFTVGIVLLTFATSVVLTITANESLQFQLTRQSLHLADSLGRQARLSLLYESPEEARSVAEIALQYPDVVGIRISTSTGITLWEQGASSPPNMQPAPTTIKTALVDDGEQYLIFVAPVRTDVEDDGLWQEGGAEEKAQEELLGHLTIVVTKDSLDRIWIQLLRSNLIVSTAVAIPLLALLLLLTRRLTNPLRSLSAVMLRAEQGELNLRESLDGPKDIAEMQKAFNTMMVALESRTRELKNARDEALLSGQVKTEFAANVSHELRTPMNSVLGMLDLLSVMGLNSQQQDYVETAKLSAEGLLALIDDILAYVTSDTGKLVLANAPCDLEAVMEDVTTLMSTQAMKKKLDIGYVIYPAGPRVIVDQQRLRQVLINLIGNAIKFTEAGEIAVTLSLSGEDNSNLVFTISDTGIGISADWQEKVFEAFTQEDSTPTRKAGGTGLGLAICKQFISLMGGTISLASQKGIGSTFTFTIPYLPVAAATISEGNSAGIAVCPVDLKGLRICVLDDSAIVRSYIEHWCVRRGAWVDLFTAIGDFLEYLSFLDGEDTTLDYLFLDEDLLGLSAENVVSLLAKHPCGSAAKVVFMVNPWSKFRRQGIENRTVLEKPLFNSRLVNVFSNGQALVLKAAGAKAWNNVRLGLNVLIVDDNYANCQVASGMLERLGCGHDSAYNGQEALELLARKEFDVVLMDCNMPIMDGYEATSRLRNLASRVKTIPVLAMTANNSPEERERCLQAGMNDFVGKPLTVKTLSALLEKWSGAAKSLPPSVLDADSDSLTDGIDTDAIDELRQCIGEVFNSAADAFIEDIPGHLDGLKSAIYRSDFQQVLELAHTIKGSAANLGGKKVSQLAGSLENMAKAADLLGADELFERIAICARVLTDFLHGYIDRNSVSKHGNARSSEVPVLLVAEDDRSTRIAYATTLRSEGYKIIEVANGRSAVAFCERAMPDLIIMDAIMPEMDGFIACRKIREMSGGAEIPILVVTSLEDEESITLAFKAGATDYITKPVNFSVLRQRAARLLNATRIERQVRRLAYQDVLTGLPNRAYFNQQLRLKINRASLNDSNLALLFLDLDRFKVINDSLGHDTGDLVLKAAAERIKNSVRSTDLVSRLGGDEFTIVLEDLYSKENAAEISKKIVDAIFQPFVFLKQRLFISASIGIAFYPGDGKTSGELIKHADNAMFKAKESGQSYCYYDNSMENEAIKRLRSESELRTAFEDDQFFLVYQLQFDFATNAVRGVEALVRWRHPEKGILAAGAFVPTIEAMGMIVELGHVVFRKACQQLRVWCDQGLELLVAVNVSGGEFQEGKLTQHIFALLDEFQIPEGLLEVEITESMLMEHPEVAQRELARIRQRRIAVAIDDFGTGFSSLNYLKRFAVDILKIDREFVKDCENDRTDQGIISGIIALAKSLNLQVVAEGVENQAQYDFLKSTGCDIAQGYLLAKPMAPDDPILMAAIGTQPR